MVNGRGEKASEAYVSDNMYDTFTIVPYFTNNSTQSQQITFYNNGVITIEEGTSNILLYDSIRKKWDYKLFDKQNSFKFVSPQPKKKKAKKTKPKKDKKDGRNGNSLLLSDRLMVVKSEG